MGAVYIVRLGDEVMPFFQEIAAFIWGEVNYNSEGDSRWPTDREWTELDIYRRDVENRAVAISPRDSERRESLVEADDREDAELAAFLLAHRTGGQIFDSEGVPLDSERLTQAIGNLEVRLARADAFRERFLAPDFRPWW